MADTLKYKDGTTASTTQTADAHLPHQLTVFRVPGDPSKGADIFVKESIASTGVVTWRWHRFEPPAK